MIKIVVCVVIYDRLKNLNRWIKIWEKLKPENAELRIIHNVHPTNHVENFAEVVGKRDDIKYIPRMNIGMDIGAFQDVCRNRLNGFEYNFEYLLWFTDDTFPIKDNFIEEYLKHFKNPKVGLTCYEISPQVKKHVRTTGFCVKINTLPNIKFDTHQIRTKQDCYDFEHRSENNLMNQILSLGLEVVQIAPIKTSPVYDTEGGGLQWTDRTKEFLRFWEFEMPPAKVVVISPAFLRFPTIVASMLSQTYENWELHLVHAGPAPHDYPKFKDERIKFFQMSSNRKNFGHPIRFDWLNKVKAKEIVCDYVLVTNDDNYHVPHFLEKLVTPLDKDPELIGSYCSMMVHNYQGGPEYEPGPDHDPTAINITDGYGIIDVRPEQGFIDCACVLFRSEIAGNTGWKSYRHSSDWDYVNTAAMSNGGWEKMKRVFGCLVTHV